MLLAPHIQNFRTETIPCNEKPINKKKQLLLAPCTCHTTPLNTRFKGPRSRQHSNAAVTTRAKQQYSYFSRNVVGDPVNDRRTKPGNDTCRRCNTRELRLVCFQQHDAPACNRHPNLTYSRFILISQHSQTQSQNPYSYKYIHI